MNSALPSHHLVGNAPGIWPVSLPWYQVIDPYAVLLAAAFIDAVAIDDGQCSV